MIDYELLDEEYEAMPLTSRIARKPQTFEREGSLTGYLRQREGAYNGAKNRIKENG